MQNQPIKKWTETLEEYRAPMRIVLIYLVLGGLWILFSDQILGLLVFDQTLYLKISVVKGWFYVFVTGAVLLKLIHSDFSRIEMLNGALREKNMALQQSNEEIHGLYEEASASEETLQASYNELQAYHDLLEASEERYRLVLKATREGFWEYHPSTDHLEVSDGFCRILGSDLEAGPGLADSIRERIHPEDRHRVAVFQREPEISGEQPEAVELRVRHENGSYRWIQVQGLIVRGAGGDMHRVVGAIRDIHDRVLQQERIEYYAFHDPSTGFHNRDFMLEQLSRRFLGRELGESPFAFLVVGIQGMERISNVYGTSITEIIHYQVGMSILRAVGNEEAIAMLGSGRFGILLDTLPEEEDLKAQIDAIDALAKVPIRINQLTVSIQTAYGAARCMSGFCEPEMLVQQAEMAFFHAAGEFSHEHVVWYNPVLREEKEYLGKVEFLLRQALEAGEFSLVYQPQVEDDSSTGVQGYEALIRWNNPELGFVSPSVFIPVAEATGQIEGIGAFVMESACRFLGELKDRTGIRGRVSINASLMELMNPEYCQRLVAHLEANDLQPENVHIEITESALAKYLDSVIENLRVLRNAGFEIHLDDFGTGYSSLNHLGRLPVHALKIDRTFVMQMESDPRMHQMTDLIIKVGHQLDLRIIAEGVETESQYRMLREMGCDSYQGYYFSRPVTGDALMNS